MAIVNKNGQLFTGYPFDKSQSFASEERRALRAILGRTYGVVRDLPDKAFKGTPKSLSVDIDTGTAIINGGFVNLKEVVNVKVDANSTGYIVIQFDLSQDNNSSGTPEDGSYEYMLNQINIKAIKDEPQYDANTDAALRYDVPLYKYTVTTGNPTLTDVRRFAFLDFPAKRTDLGNISGAWNGVELPGDQANVNVTNLANINWADRAAANGLVVRKGTKDNGVLIIENHTHREIDLPVIVEAQAGAKSGAKDRNNKFAMTVARKNVNIGADDTVANILSGGSSVPVMMNHIAGTGVIRISTRLETSFSVLPGQQIMFALRFNHSVSFNKDYPMSLSWVNLVINMMASNKLDPVN